MNVQLFFIVIAIFISTVIAQAQTSSPSGGFSGGTVNYRLLANYDYIMISPNDLNNYNSSITWGGTTQAQGSFRSMNGYSIGAGYLVKGGFIGVEYSYGIQELPNTVITPTTSTIQYSFDYHTLYLMYDWVSNLDTNQSYELGAGLGYALKYQYHWVQKTATAIEEVIWQANPIIFKVRANYNYHFTKNILLRTGATYEYATSSGLTADSNHPLLGVTSGQSLRYSATNQDVTVDVSGFRLNVGATFAF